MVIQDEQKAGRAQLMEFARVRQIARALIRVRLRPSGILCLLPSRDWRENLGTSESGSLPMFFKLFRKHSELRPRIERDSSLAEELVRRVNSIEFQPSKGFLKDQRQSKRVRWSSN